MNRADRMTLSMVAAPVFILQPGQDGRPVYDFVNAAWLDSLGREEQDVIGRHAAEVFDGPAGIEICDHQAAAFRTGRSFVYDVTLPFGEVGHRVRTSLSPIRDDSGNVIEIVGTKFDQGEVARAHDLRADAHEMAAEIEAFISLAAHDLRAPMRQIRILTEMLREDSLELDDMQISILDKLAVVASKSSEMISDILSHAQAVTAEREVCEFRLGGLVADLLLVLDPLRQHSVVSEDIALVGDRMTLQVVLRNLFDNAFKHSRRSDVSLQVEVRDAGGGMLEFSVSDSGEGFPDPAVAFLQGGALRPDSGFGLAGVRRVIRSRGGRISARNRVDGGAEVSFTISGHMAAEPRRGRRLLAS